MIGQEVIEVRVRPGRMSAFCRVTDETVTVGDWVLVDIGDERECGRVIRGPFAQAELETLHEDYVRTATAKGVSARSVLIRHVLPNAVLPVVTVVGLQFGYLLGGIVAIEMVFNWPGIGYLMVRSVQIRDFPVIQGVIIVVASTFVFVNLLVDLAYAVLDPRIREGMH